MRSITLLSDFGLQDASVGRVRGTLLQHLPEATIADISHELTPFDVAQASYLLAASYRSFPERSVHLVFVDIFYQQRAKLVLCEFDGHYFLVPDNGVMTHVLNSGAYSSRLCFEMTPESSFGDWVHAAAAAIGALQTKKPEEIGETSYMLTNKVNNEVTLLAGNKAMCKVLYIDVFGNVVLNITKEQFDRLNSRGRFKMQFMHVNEISEVSNYYNDVRRGQELCRFNSKGYLEICVNRGNAANLFGFRMRGAHNDIQITFE